MLKAAADAGTTDIVATPHANNRFPFCLDLVEEKLAQLRSAVACNIRIHSGCDFHLSYGNIQDALRYPSKYTINNRCYLLVEFSDISVFGRHVNVFTQLLDAGITPIITHPERNSLIRSRIDDLQKWVLDGCLVQVTAQSFRSVRSRREAVRRPAARQKSYSFRCERCARL